jgi:betaine reductase
VVLGSPDANSAELYAETVTHGDPTWAGALAGVPLGLPVYHIVEPEIKASVEPSVYEAQVGVMDVALEKDQITEALNKVRAKGL